MNTLKQDLFEIIAHFDVSGDRNKAVEFFSEHVKGGVSKKTFAAWKRVANPPWEVAEAVHAFMYVDDGITTEQPVPANAGEDPMAGEVGKVATNPPQVFVNEDGERVNELGQPIDATGQPIGAGKLVREDGITVPGVRPSGMAPLRSLRGGPTVRIRTPVGERGQDLFASSRQSLPPNQPPIPDLQSMIAAEIRKALAGYQVPANGGAGSKPALLPRFRKKSFNEPVPSR